MQIQLQPRPMPQISLPTKIVYSTGDDFVNPVIPASNSRWRRDNYYRHAPGQLKKNKTKTLSFKEILVKVIKLLLGSGIWFAIWFFIALGWKW